MQYVIFHGSFGSANSNWFPWLKMELEAKGHEVFIPQFPVETYEEALEALKQDESYNYTKFRLEVWLKTFENEVLPKLTGETVFIGHSLGPLFILHILSTFKLKLTGAYFVAPFFSLPEDDPPYDLAIRNFSVKDLDLNEIKTRLGKSYALYSDNDPYVAVERAEEFANALGAKPVLMPGKMHFSKELIAFPELLQLL